MRCIAFNVNKPRNLIDCPREIPVCSTLSGPLDSIGNTPMIRLKAASEETGCTIFAKAEFMNPGGSVKDRIAQFIVQEAITRGDLHADSTIMEVTSGNTGIALAMVGAMNQRKVVIRMPKTVSVERRRMIESFGAKLELLEDLLRIQAAVAQAEKEAAQNPKIFLTRQFSNPDNPRCHETTTGPEIIRQTKGCFDAFVMGVGTGGTLMGVGRAIRNANVPAEVIAVEPDESAVLSGGPPGRHGIQGLADGFIPAIVQQDQIDHVVRIKTVDAVEMSRKIGREEGLLVGISSGANVLGAIETARRLGPGKRIVTVLPDRGERYLSLTP